MNRNTSTASVKKPLPPPSTKQKSMWPSKRSKEISGNRWQKETAVFPSPLTTPKPSKEKTIRKRSNRPHQCRPCRKRSRSRRRSQVAKQKPKREIQKARALAQTSSWKPNKSFLKKSARKRSRSKRKPKRRATSSIARGEAEAILAIKQAEAEGIQKLLDAKAKGYKQLVEACGDDAKSASTMLLIEKLEEIVKMQVEAIKNIKIDKITVWDSGSNSNDPSKRLFDFKLHQPVRQVLPALHDVASMAGLELPHISAKSAKTPLRNKSSKASIRISGVLTQRCQAAKTQSFL